MSWYELARGFSGLDATRKRSRIYGQHLTRAHGVRMPFTLSRLSPGVLQRVLIHHLTGGRAIRSSVRVPGAGNKSCVSWNLIDLTRKLARNKRRFGFSVLHFEVILRGRRDGTCANIFSVVCVQSTSGCLTVCPSRDVLHSTNIPSVSRKIHFLLNHVITGPAAE